LVWNNALIRELRLSRQRVWWKLEIEAGDLLDVVRGGGFLDRTHSFVEAFEVSRLAAVDYRARRLHLKSGAELVDLGHIVRTQGDDKAAAPWSVFKEAFGAQLA